MQIELRISSICIKLKSVQIAAFVVWLDQKPHFGAFKDMHTHFGCEIHKVLLREKKQG